MTVDAEVARKFFADHTWRFAKTYARFAPHEYIVGHRLPPEEQELFATVVAFVRACAKPEEFHGKIFQTYMFDDKKYWITEDSSDGAVIINRTYPGIQP